MLNHLPSLPHASLSPFLFLIPLPSPPCSLSLRGTTDPVTCGRGQTLVLALCGESGPSLQARLFPGSGASLVQSAPHLHLLRSPQPPHCLPFLPSNFLSPLTSRPAPAPAASEAKGEGSVGGAGAPTPCPVPPGAPASQWPSFPSPQHWRHVYIGLLVYFLLSPDCLGDRWEMHFPEPSAPQPTTHMHRSAGLHL